jgi:uncharacterized phiE125 gp8 family phage protein
MSVSTRQYRTVVVTPPAVEPISTAQAKMHLRVDGAVEDSYIDERIAGARAFVEKNTRRALINTVLKLNLDDFPSEIRLPGGMLQGVTHIKYYDADGAQQTLSSSLYTVDTTSEPGRVVPAYDETWPAIRVIPNAVEVQYTVGYGSAASSVPQDLKDAVLMMVAHRYENREAVSEESMADVPLAVKTIITNNKIQEFF